MAEFQWQNQNELESFYFWPTIKPKEQVNKLVSLGVLEEEKPPLVWLDKTFDRQKKESEDTWILEKTSESFIWWLSRIKEAWEWLANDKYNMAEAFVRWGAGALQSFFSPVSGLIWEWVQEWIQLLSDDFKKNVMESAAPTITSIVQWYQWQSPEQQRNLDNIWVWLEVLLELVWWSAVKKPLKEIWEEMIWWTIQTWKRVGEQAIKVWEDIIEWAKGIIPTKSETDVLQELWLETVKGKIWDIVVDVPKQSETITKKVVWAVQWTPSDKVLAGRAVSPRVAGKSPKQRLSSVADVEKNTRQFYENVRTWVLEWDISTLENAAQTIVNNIDIVWSRIWNAVKKIDWTIQFDNKITDDIIDALNTKGAEVSPATTVLNKFFETLWDWNLSIADAYELKKAYSNEVNKLYKAWDAWTKQYKALSDWVDFLNKSIDEIIEKQLWSEFANDKAIFRNLKTIVDDMVASSLVEWRKAPNTFAERIWMVESLFSPVSSIKAKLISEAENIQTRGWAWKALIDSYDKQAIEALTK